MATINGNGMNVWMEIHIYYIYIYVYVYNEWNLLTWKSTENSYVLQEAIALIEPMINDPVNFVRQVSWLLYCVVLYLVHFYDDEILYGMIWLIFMMIRCCNCFETVKSVSKVNKILSIRNLILRAEWIPWKHWISSTPLFFQQNPD